MAIYEIFPENFHPSRAMSNTSNQKPITSFFQAPKRSRPCESDVETTDDRPSKLSRAIRIRDSDSPGTETDREKLHNNLDEVLSTHFSEDREILSIKYRDNSNLSINEDSAS